MKRKPIFIDNSYCGIYQITNTITGKFYIGSAKNIKERWNSHKSELRRNTHCNYRLQNSWNKYGESAFKFSVLDICDEENRFELEQFYLDETQCYLSEIGYNIARIVECPPMTEESRKRQSESLKSNTEFMNYCSKFMTKLHADPETQQKIINAIKSSEKCKENLQKLNESEEHKQQVQDLLKQLHSDPKIQDMVKNLANKNIKSESWRNKKNVKYIICMNENFVPVYLFNSLTKAGNFVGSFHDTIKIYCENGKLFKGYHWMYLSDYEEKFGPLRTPITLS